MSNHISNALLPPEAQIHLRAVEDRLKTYVETMAPGRVLSAQDGAFQQTQLWQGVINFLLQQPAEVFMAGWAHLLEVINENRGACFSPAYINRFRENVRMTLPERRNFERLMHLAMQTSDRRSRALALRQIDMNVILAGLPSESQRQKLVGFYQL